MVKHLESLVDIVELHSVRDKLCTPRGSIPITQVRIRQRDMLSLCVHKFFERRTRVHVGFGGTIERNFLRHVLIDQLGDACPALVASKRRPKPLPSSNKLERASRDLGARGCDSDDDTLAPAPARPSTSQLAGAATQAGGLEGGTCGSTRGPLASCRPGQCTRRCCRCRSLSLTCRRSPAGKTNHEHEQTAIGNRQSDAPVGWACHDPWG